MKCQCNLFKLRGISSGNVRRNICIGFVCEISSERWGAKNVKISHSQIKIKKQRNSFIQKAAHVWKIFLLRVKLIELKKSIKGDNNTVS